MAAFEESVRAQARAVGLIVRGWDLGSQAKIRFRLGLALARVGRLAEALTEQDLAAAAFHEAAETDNEALALTHKGDLLLQLGRFRDAIPAYEQSLRLTAEGTLPVAGAPWPRVWSSTISAPHCSPQIATATPSPLRSGPSPSSGRLATGGRGQRADRPGPGAGGHGPDR